MAKKNVWDKYNQRREQDIEEQFVEPIREALKTSALTYSGPATRAFIEYLKDPTNPEKFAKVSLKLAESYDQERKRITCSTCYKIHDGECPNKKKETEGV